MKQPRIRLNLIYMDDHCNLIFLIHSLHKLLDCFSSVPIKKKGKGYVTGNLHCKEKKINNKKVNKGNFSFIHKNLL